MKLNFVALVPLVLVVLVVLVTVLEAGSLLVLHVCVHHTAQYIQY